MASAVASSRTELLIAIPYEPFAGNPDRNELILHAMAEMPNLFPLPLESTEERMVAVAHTLTAPDSFAYEVWHSGKLCGIFLLTKVVPGLDAMGHMFFLDRQLFGRTKLIQRVIGQVFEQFGLERLSVEIPEHLTALIDFVRRKLSFKYEGEPAAIAAKYSRARSLAAWGSRREHSFWDGSQWRDTIRLRLLRSEYEAMVARGG